jgi:hypothetical protein
VNALTSSFRYALATGRLFFIVWRSSNDPAMWKRGLMEPGFEWDWNDALKTHPECGFRKNDIESVRASRADNKPPPRVVLIRGTIVADNPVAHATEGLYESDDTRMVMYGLGEGALQDFLLVPNAELQSLISSTASRLYDARPADYWATVGIQIRTGYADAPDAKKRPGNANFLAQGDEKLFVEKFLELWRAKAAGFPARTKVFLMTDSPVIAEKVRKDLSEKHGVEVVTVTEGEVAHCGPTQTITQTGVMRMLAEWFVFKLHTDVQIITAWSLFGGSAVEGRNGGQVYRIDASNCGKTSAKPCQNSY